MTYPIKTRGIDTVDPRIVQSLIRMPSYYVGQQSINRGFEDAWDFANAQLESHNMGRFMNEVAYEVYALTGLRGARLESGDSPGMPSYVEVPTDDPSTVSVYWSDDSVPCRVEVVFMERDSKGYFTGRMEPTFWQRYYFVNPANYTRADVDAVVDLIAEVFAGAGASQ